MVYPGDGKLCSSRPYRTLSPNGSSPRDLNVYGTYPRNIHCGNGINETCEVNGKVPTTTSNHYRESDLSDQKGLRGILRNKNNYSPIQIIYGDAHGQEDTLDTTHDSFPYGESDQSDRPLSDRKSTNNQQSKSSCCCCTQQSVGFCVETYLRPGVAEFMSVFFATFIITFVEAALQELRVQAIIHVGVIALCEGGLLGIFLMSFHDMQ